MEITSKILIVNSISLSKREVFRISRKLKFNISYVPLSQLFNNRTFRQRIVDNMVEPIKMSLNQSSISRKLLMLGPKYKNIKLNIAKTK